MVKSAAGLRALADQILGDAREKAKELRAKADEVEAQEDQALLRKLRSSGRLQALKDELFAVQGTPARKPKQKTLQEQPAEG